MDRQELETMALPTEMFWKENRKKRRQGVILITLPFLAVFSVLAAVLGLQFLAADPAHSSAVRSANAILFGLGGLSFLSLFVLIPLGIARIMMADREMPPGTVYDARSGQGDASVVPLEISGWNWGAAFLGFWWGLYFRVWIMFVLFVPVIGSFWWIAMGLKGNEWAWRQNKWVSVEEFQAKQNKWKPWAIASLIVSLLAFILFSWGTTILTSKMSGLLPKDLADPAATFRSQTNTLDSFPMPASLGGSKP